MTTLRDLTYADLVDVHRERLSLLRESAEELARRDEVTRLRNEAERKAATDDP